MDTTWRSPIWITACLAVAACQPPADEYREALPNQDTVTVDLPARDQTARGLGSRSDAIVGEPAEWYTSTYYESRKINALGAAVITIVETIVSYPATEVDETRAVWGPFSEEREPNEFKLTIAKDDVDASFFVWAIEGRHKSKTEFVTLARGAFEPDGEDQGRGWFALDLDTIRELDPSEDGRGRVAYAFEKNEKGLAVRVHFVGVGDNGERAEAGYVFGEDVDGNGHVLFAFDTNVDESSGRERALIRTRWLASGAGRADVIATGGDLEARVVRGSQCWGEDFISAYESFHVDGEIIAADGAIEACRLADEAMPSNDEVPTADDVLDPYAGTQID